MDWLAVISEKIKCSHGVLHLAVYFMDYFMDKFDIQEPQLHLVALSCLLLAGKLKFLKDHISPFFFFHKQGYLKSQHSHSP